MMFLCLLGGRLALAFDTNLVLLVPSVSAVHPLSPVTIEFFNEPGCEECAKVNDLVLPELAQRYGERYVLTRLDMGVLTNYLRLVSYQKKLGEVNAPVYMVLDGHKILSGFKDIEAGSAGTG